MGQRGTGSGQHPLASDHLEAALQADCEALVALQVIRSLANDELEPHVIRAIDALRRAIVDLRAARGETRSPLAHGFVTDVPGDGSGGLQ